MTVMAGYRSSTLISLHVSAPRKTIAQSWLRASILLMKKNGNRAEKGFHVFATKAAGWVGTKWALLLALLVIVVWLASGPYFHYSTTWHLIINPGRTVLTVLGVFLLQN